MLKRKVRVSGADRQMPIREALIRKLRELSLSGDQRAISLQRRILDEAGEYQTEHLDPEETKRQFLSALSKMGVKVIYDE